MTQMLLGLQINKHWYSYSYTV